MNSGLTSGLTSAPLRTAVVRRTQFGGIVVGGGRATGIGSFASVGGSASGLNSVAVNGTASALNSVSFGGTASGNKSVSLSGGIASGISSFIVAESGTCSGYQSSVVGGGSNSNSGTASFVTGGSFNTINSIDSGVVIGSACTVSANNAMATGLRCIADQTLMQAYGIGGFGANTTGTDIRIVKQGLRAITEDNALTSMRLNSVGVSPFYRNISSGRVLTGIVHILGSKLTTGTIAAYMRRFTIKNVGGVTALEGTVDTVGADVVNGTSISIVANDTSDYLDIQVAGVSGETWRWAAYLRALEITIA